MLLREIKNIFHLELDAIYCKEEVASFFYILIEHHLKLERFILVLHPDFVVSKQDEQLFFEGLSKLKLNKPIQYITGNTIFMDFDFYVDENVLIPRPETEELVLWILNEEQHNEKELKILDIGTGSGCIAISLAKNIKNANIFALDISKKALSVAKKNAALNSVEITFLEADILNLPDYEEKFDVIVSNPPYVRELEKKEMAKNVLDNEPGLALFVTDDKPLVFYENIVAFANTNLNEGGTLYFEINQFLSKETNELLVTENFKDVKLRKDIFGKDRMMKANFNKR